jgi:hypothetical protein
MSQAVDAALVSDDMVKACLEVAQLRRGGQRLAVVTPCQYRYQASSTTLRSAMEQAAHPANALGHCWS